LPFHISLRRQRGQIRDLYEGRVDLLAGRARWLAGLPFHPRAGNPSGLFGGGVCERNRSPAAARCESYGPIPGANPLVKALAKTSRGVSTGALRATVSKPSPQTASLQTSRPNDRSSTPGFGGGWAAKALAMLQPFKELASSDQPRTARQPRARRRLARYWRGSWLADDRGESDPRRNFRRRYLKGVGGAWKSVKTPGEAK